MIAIFWVLLVLCWCPFHNRYWAVNPIWKWYYHKLRHTCLLLWSNLLLRNSQTFRSTRAPKTIKSAEFSDCWRTKNFEHKRAARLTTYIACCSCQNKQKMENNHDDDTKTCQQPLPASITREIQNSTENKIESGCNFDKFRNFDVENSDGDEL